MGDFLTVVGILLAFITGGIGILQAHKANQAADGAMRASEEAGRASADALEIARRTESRATEVSNIHWEGYWAGRGVYRLVNKGDDDAHNVRAVVTVDDEEIRGAEALVAAAGGELELRFPQANLQWQQDRAEYRQWERDSGRTGPYGIPLSSSIAPMFFHTIRERVDWVTESGAPGKYEKFWKLADIGPEF